jgi:D-hexose-6-phosphate mutarotase
LIGGMTDLLVVQSLRDLRAEILGRITAYEAQIAQAKHDLAHLNATLRLFTEPEKQRARYLVSHGFFKKGEIADICVGQLEVDGAMTTRELAERVMAARRLDIADATQRNSVVFKVVQALRHAKRRRLVRMMEKHKGVCVWAPGDAVTLRVVASSPSSSG